MLTELCVSGANTDVFYMVGAVKAAMFGEHGDYLQGVTRFRGTSAGSLVCCLILVYRERMQNEAEFDALVTQCTRALLEFTWSGSAQRFGWYNVEPLIRAVLSAIGIPPEYRLGDFTCGELHVTTFCLESCETRVLSSCDTPGMPLALALSMSCCIPFVFAPIVHNGMHHVDGSLCEYLPEGSMSPSTLYVMMDLDTPPFSELHDLEWYVKSILFSPLRNQCAKVLKVAECFFVIRRSPDVKEHPLFFFNCTGEGCFQMLRSGWHQFTEWTRTP